MGGMGERRGGGVGRKVVRICVLVNVEKRKGERMGKRRERRRMRGRMREFLIGVLFGGSVVGFVWFSILGV